MISLIRTNGTPNCFFNQKLSAFYMVQNPQMQKYLRVISRGVSEEKDQLNIRADGDDPDPRMVCNCDGNFNWFQ